MADDAKDVGVKVGGIQVGPGIGTKPAIAFQQDDDTGFGLVAPGIIGVYAAGAEVGRLPDDLGGSPGGLDTHVQYNDAGAFGGDTGLTFNETTDVLTVSGGLVSPSVGPAAAQQHTLPAVASDIVALLAAVQTLTNKVIGAGSTLNNASVGPHGFGVAADARFQWNQGGTFSGTNIAYGYFLGTTLVPTAGNSSRGFYVGPTFQEAGSGTHPKFAVFTIDPATTAGAATVTDNVGLEITGFAVAAGTTNAILIQMAGLPTGATNNVIFELPVNAVDPTGGGGAATGRVPCLIGGVVRYLAYY